MGARVIRIPGVAVARRKKEDLRALLMIVSTVTLPLLLTFILIGADMRSDLGDLTPTQHMADDTTALVGWGDLEMPDGKQAPANQTQWKAPQRARMLGYMVDGYPPSKDGALVQMFVLLPEAGHILHPAHRIPDQMVEVRLAHPAPFEFRSLVWVSGTLLRTATLSKSDKAMYAMTGAAVQPAADSDITRWFKP